MVIIMIALAESEDRHDPAVARTATIRVRLAANGMAKRVDEKSHMLHCGHPGHTGEQETAQCAQPARMQKTKQSGHEESEAHRDQSVIFILQHEEPVLAQILNVVERWLGIEFEENPAHVGVPKTLGNIIRIIGVIDMFVMPAVIRNPVHGAVFESRSPENQCHQPHRPARLERNMGEKTVITKGDAQTGRDEKEEKHRNLESIHTALPKV